MKSTQNKHSWIGKFFTLWILTMVFGANLLPVKLPGFTLYLNLILGVGLFFMLFVKVGVLRAIKHLKYALLVYFLLGLGLYAVLFSEGVSEAIFTLRALLVFALTVSNLILAFAYFGRQDFTEKLKVGLWYYISICLLFGTFEFFTGIHFAGDHTDKLLELPVSYLTYAPTFLWDNPNTYIAYISVTAVSLLIIDRTIETSVWKQLVLFFPILFFSVVSQSTFGIMIAVLLAVIFIVVHLKSVFSTMKSSALLLLASVLFMLITFFSNQIFYGPKWENGEQYRLNGLTTVNIVGDDVELLSKEELLDKVDEDTLIKRLHDNVYSTMGSFELRKNLILNGLDYWKQKPVLGIGAGQYSYYNTQNRNKYPVEDLLQPHNFTVEILAQYGVIGVLFILMLLVALIRMIRRSDGRSRMVILIGGAFIFLIASCLPSSFLIYDCLWLFVGLVLIEGFIAMIPSQTDESK